MRDCHDGVTTDSRRIMDGGRGMLRTRGTMLVTNGHCRMNGNAMLRLGDSRISLARTRLACGRSVCSCLMSGTSLSRMLNESRMVGWAEGGGGVRGRVGGDFRLMTLFTVVLLNSYANKGRRGTIRGIRSGPGMGLTSMATQPISRVRRCATAMRTRIGGGVTPTSPIEVSGVFMRINSHISGKRGLMLVSRTDLGRVGLRLRGGHLRFGHTSRLCGMNNASGSR